METFFLNIARILPRSKVNGPGERFVIWLQGCDLHCPGCWNPHMWSLDEGEMISVNELAALIRSTPDIEGVTLTGGEPFLQASVLPPLLKAIREMKLSVMIFSGYEMKELHKDAHRIVLSDCDILVSGRYMQQLRTLEHPWRGSKNQEIHFLTNRYDDSSIPISSDCEIHLDNNGKAILTGFPIDSLYIEML